MNMIIKMLLLAVRERAKKTLREMALLPPTSYYLKEVGILLTPFTKIGGSDFCHYKGEVGKIGVLF